MAYLVPITSILAILGTVALAWLLDRSRQNVASALNRVLTAEIAKNLVVNDLRVLQTKYDSLTQTFLVKKIELQREIVAKRQLEQELQSTLTMCATTSDPAIIAGHIQKTLDRLNIIKKEPP